MNMRKHVVSPTEILRRILSHEDLKLLRVLDQVFFLRPRSDIPRRRKLLIPILPGKVLIVIVGASCFISSGTFESSNNRFSIRVTQFLPLLVLALLPLLLLLIIAGRVSSSSTIVGWSITWKWFPPIWSSFIAIVLVGLLFLVARIVIGIHNASS